MGRFHFKNEMEGDRITVKSNEQKYKELQIAKLSVWNLTVKVSVEPSTSAEFHTGNGFSASLNGYEFIFFMTTLYWQNFPNVHGVLLQLTLNLRSRMEKLFPVPVLQCRPMVTF